MYAHGFVDNTIDTFDKDDFELDEQMLVYKIV